MGEVVENSISYIKENFPEVIIKNSDSYIEFRGRFVIKVQFNDKKLDIAPKLLLLFPYKYPNQLPNVYELENKIDSTHKLNDGALCVATRFDLITQLCMSSSLKDYIEKFLIPYFITYYNYIDTGKYIYGDRSHGVNGIYQSIGEYFNVDQNNKEFIANLMLWASKKERFKKVFFKNAYVINRKYGARIGELRKTGIYNLRKVDSEMKALKELEKRYFEYVNRKKKLYK